MLRHLASYLPAQFQAYINNAALHEEQPAEQHHEPVAPLTFSQRYEKLGREKVDDFDRVPLLFTDQINMIPLDEPVFTDKNPGHVLDKSFVDHMKELINPFSNHPFKLIPEEVMNLFTSEEIDLLNQAINLVNFQKPPLFDAATRTRLQHLRIYINGDKTFSKIDNPGLLLLEKAFQEAKNIALEYEQSPLLSGLLDKIDFHYRNRLKDNLIKQQEVFLTSLNNIQRLQEIIKWLLQPTRLEGLTAEEVKALEIWQYQYEAIFYTKLALVNELKKFIADTKIIIYSNGASDAETKEELQRVLGAELNILHTLQMEFGGFLNTEEQREFGIDKQITLDKPVEAAQLPNDYICNNGALILPPQRETAHKAESTTLRLSYATSTHPALLFNQGLACFGIWPNKKDENQLMRHLRPIK